MKVFESKFKPEDLIEVNKIIQSGELGFGPNVSVFENEFSSYSNKKFNTATNSASASAFLIFAYLKEKFGPCDVYTPSLGFTSPAWAAQHHGHHLSFVDVDDNLLFDTQDYLNKRTSERQTVIMPVLYGGVSTLSLKGLIGDEVVVVDSAHCATPTVKSNFIFFSFHPYKPICSSDGGMISTDDEEASNFFNSYRNFGRSNNINGYDIKQNGFKFYMNNLNATIALKSLSLYSKNLEDRRSNFQKLKHEVADFHSPIFNQNLLGHDDMSSFYFATIIADSKKVDQIKKIYPTSTHYPLMHKTTFYKSDNCLYNSERLYSKIVNVPLHE